jgi:hypothetical protein
MNIRKWTLTTMLLAPVLLLSLTACTGTEPPSNAEGSSPSAATETADSTHAWNVKYVECLRRRVWRCQTLPLRRASLR